MFSNVWNILYFKTLTNSYNGMIHCLSWLMPKTANHSHFTQKIQVVTKHLFWAISEENLIYETHAYSPTNKTKIFYLIEIFTLETDHIHPTFRNKTPGIRNILFTIATQCDLLSERRILIQSPTSKKLGEEERKKKKCMKQIFKVRFFWKLIEEGSKYAKERPKARLGSFFPSSSRFGCIGSLDFMPY